MVNPEITKSKILEFANEDARVRAVVLNGSQANPTIKEDAFQDFDVVFFVENFYSFISDKAWLDHFGKPYLQQFPDEMELGSDPNEEKVSFTILTVFEDGSRIDIRLFPIEKFKTKYEHDSLSVVWLDKDRIFENQIDSSDLDYHIKKPSLQEFSEVCNDFWWCCPYVAKGLKRNQIFYAKDQLETIVRPMFMRLISWKIGIDTHFSVSFGKSGKHAETYLNPQLYQRILKTYSDSDLESNWNALKLMMQLFYKEQVYCAEKLQFPFNKREAENSIEYVSKIEKFGEI